MSTVNTVIPTAAVQGTNTSGTNSFASLTPSDFVNMMVTELQNQDPLQPASSQDLLAQMSQIGQLESSDQLQTTLTGMTLQNQIGAASQLIGHPIMGTDASGNSQTGTVSTITITQTPAAQSPTGVATTNVNLNLNTGATVPLGNVTAIGPVPATTSTTPTVNPPASTAQNTLISSAAQAAAINATNTVPPSLISAATA
ncbi:MAG: flagellar hook capping FlgD N-terminal domain-containing protein [Tepidisphaeraceae bacterium]|jgi:flagellar basal-body rod modification protein FlgD